MCLLQEHLPENSGTRGAFLRKGALRNYFFFNFMQVCVAQDKQKDRKEVRNINRDLNNKVSIITILALCYPSFVRVDPIVFIVTFVIIHRSRKRVKFHNTGAEQQIGLIVMSIDDSDKAQQLDADISGIVVIFNTSKSAKTVNFENAEQYQLHPIQQKGVDTIVKQSSSNENSFSVSALTTSVFIKKR